MMLLDMVQRRSLKVVEFSIPNAALPILSTPNCSTTLLSLCYHIVILLIVCAAFVSV